MTQLNLWLCVAGIAGWFAVGMLWRDNAIMVVHAVALVAMVFGLLAR